MAERREVIRKMIQGTSLIGLSSLVWGDYVNENRKADFVLRPPAAKPETQFMKDCIKCGACVVACPYDTLKLASAGNNIPEGTPYFVPRKTACEMCPDIPCVPVCPSGALDIKSVTVFDVPSGEEKLDINLARMGLAIVDPKSCIAHWGVQCDVCYRACPLMDKAIRLDYERNERTGKHAFLKPVVNENACTGCGLCEHACITEIPSIRVLPLSLINGKAGDHYIKGWDENDEQRLKNQEEKPIDEGTDKALKYLNGDWEDLIDE